MFDRQRIRAMWNRTPGAVAAPLVVALLLALLPARAIAPLRCALEAALEPGRIVAGRLAARARDLAVRFEQTAATSEDVARLTAQVQSLTERNRELTVALALAGHRDMQDQGESPVPLVLTQCLRATVLGRRAASALAADQIVDVGRSAGATRDSLVLAESTATIDQGKDALLARDDIVLAGRRVFGKVVEVGPHTAVIRRADQAGFRDVVQLGRLADGALRFGAKGILEGAGDGVCRVRMIGANEDVAPGDLVFSVGHEGLAPQPLWYGTVEVAERRPGATQWDIRAKLAAGQRDPSRLLVLRAALNEARLAGNKQ